MDKVLRLAGQVNSRLYKTIQGEVILTKNTWLLPAIKMQVNKIKKLVLLFFIFIFVAYYSQSAIFSYAQEIKQPDLSGSWYPSSSKKLSQMLERFLSFVPNQKIEGDIIAFIQPHAGFVYSGSIAAYGFKQIQNLDIDTVLIVGFSHKIHFDGVSVYDADAFDTPLGLLNVNKELVRELIREHPKIKFYPPAFINENSVEMQIPFLKKVLPNVSIVPIAIGDQKFETSKILAEAIFNVLKEKDKFLLIASSDMSHYLSYDEAVKKDKHTLGLLKKISAELLFKEGDLSEGGILCGISSVASVIMASQKLGADRLDVLKYANSGDISGDKTRVVGYVSAVFFKSKEEKIDDDIEVEKQERNDDMLTNTQRKRLLEIARQTIKEYLKSGEIKNFSEEDKDLLEEKGAFVTLHKSGQLRGCIGNIIASIPLYRTVRDMSIASAANDPRFKPVTLDELEDIEIEISVLSKPQREVNPENIVMGKHGVIVKSGYASGVFLPQVADETGWSREEFLSNLCAHKAGLSADAWKDKDTELYTFTAEVFNEKSIKR